MSEGKQGRSAVCFGDPDAFASEMIKMINDKEYRYNKLIDTYIVWLINLCPTSCFTVMLGLLLGKRSKLSMLTGAFLQQGT